ncbi:MAG: hypothetical protein EZS28_027861, partial [Streblomastix strix]
MSIIMRPGGQLRNLLENYWRSAQERGQGKENIVPTSESQQYSNQIQIQQNKSSQASEALASHRKAENQRDYEQVNQKNKEINKINQKQLVQQLNIEQKERIHLSERGKNKERHFEITESQKDSLQSTKHSLIGISGTHAPHGRSKDYQSNFQIGNSDDRDYKTTYQRQTNNTIPKNSDENQVDDFNNESNEIPPAPRSNPPLPSYNDHYQTSDPNSYFINDNDNKVYQYDFDNQTSSIQRTQSANPSYSQSSSIGISGTHAPHARSSDHQSTIQFGDEQQRDFETTYQRQNRSVSPANYIINEQNNQEDNENYDNAKDLIKIHSVKRAQSARAHTSSYQSGIGMSGTHAPHTRPQDYQSNFQIGDSNSDDRDYETTYDRLANSVSDNPLKSSLKIKDKEQSSMKSSKKKDSGFISSGKGIIKRDWDDHLLGAGCLPISGEDPYKIAIRPLAGPVDRNYEPF